MQTLALVGEDEYALEFLSDLGAIPIAFVTPECLRELGSIVSLLILDFELGFTATEIMLGVVIRCCFQHNILFAAFSFWRPAGFDSSIAQFYSVA